MMATATCSSFEAWATCEGEPQRSSSDSGSRKTPFKPWGRLRLAQSDAGVLWPRSNGFMAGPKWPAAQWSCVCVCVGRWGGGSSHMQEHTSCMNVVQTSSATIPCCAPGGFECTFGSLAHSIIWMSRWLGQAVLGAGGGGGGGFKW
jgi:hypothetical protein